MLIKLYDNVFRFSEGIVFNNAKEVRDFFEKNKITVPPRIPKGMNKADYQLLWEVYNLLDKKDSMTDFSIENKMKMVRLSPDQILDSFSKNEAKPDTIKGKYTTYIKRDNSSYSVFEDAIKLLEGFLGRLSGYHSKAIHNLKIKFVKPNDIKSVAKYKQDEDTLWINLFKINKWIKQDRLSSLGSDEYGSLLYVLVHELGHRYLSKVKRQSWNIDSQEWATTKYSTVDSISGEEKFAELFALSFWKSKYPEYKDKIKKFESLLENISILKR